MWRLVAPEGVAVVLLVPYKGWDQKPRVGSFREGPVETCVHRTSGPAISNDLAREPGELELLDALNLMERGDYSGAVRRVTTALEVIVESALRTELSKQHAASVVDVTLESSRSDFPGRLRQYEKLSGRRLDPGQRSEQDRTRGTSAPDRPCGSPGALFSVTDLARKLRRFITKYNERAKPVRWSYADPTRHIA